MIAIVDYGMGNLRSVQKGLEHVGGDARIVTDAHEILRAEKVVLPGVGAFRDAIDRIRSAGLEHALHRVLDDNRPFLGICLGFQLLFEESFEDGEYTGLGVFPGKVVRFEFPEDLQHRENLKVPHMGWNQLRTAPACPLFAGMTPGEYVYFVHSYHPVDVPTGDVAAWTDYGYSFCSAVWRGNVFATQFHPEKSQTVGLRMLQNFVNL
jgi:glutamine amidotransferase